MRLCTKAIIISCLMIVFAAVLIANIAIPAPIYHFYSSDTSGIIQHPMTLKGTWLNHDAENTIDFEFTYAPGARVIDVTIVPINSYECEVYIDDEFYVFLDYELNPKNFSRAEGQEIFVTYTSEHKVFWAFRLYNDEGNYRLTPWKSVSPI